MKKIYLMLLLSLAVVLAKAQNINQNGTGKITGVVIDSISKQPVDFATIALVKWADSKSVNGDISDEKGNFKLTGVPNGDYKLIITFMGYKDKSTGMFTISDQSKDIKLGKVILSPSGRVLQEVTVVGQKELIENKIDKMVYNAEKDVTSGGGDASDVLRKVPMLNVDQDGNVELRGSGNVRVLINGKPSTVMASSIADALKMIPSDQIKNVEVITSPSAKYDAEGTSGIINIITKKGNMQGVTGSVNLTGGTRRNGVNANLNYRKNKIGITANIGGNLFLAANGKSLIETENIDSALVVTGRGEQIGSNKGQRGGIRSGLGLDYDINKHNTFSTNINVNQFKFDRTGNLDVLTMGADELVLSQYDRYTENNNSRNGFDWSADYRKTFTKPQQELSFGVQISRSKSDENYLENRQPIENAVARNERGFNENTNNEYTFQLDYLHPFNKSITLETGGKTILRKIESDSRYELKDQSGAFVPNPDRSSYFMYDQNVYAGYLSMGFTIAKDYGLKVGTRWERTDIGAAFSQVQNPTKNTYDNFVPSLTLSRNFKNRNTLKVSFSQRIQRPGVSFLNPYINDSDSLNVSQGNPGLSPEKTDNYETTFTTFINKSVVNFSVYYRYTTDVIESVVSPLEGSNLGTFTTFKNVGNSSSIGVNIFGSYPLTPKWNLRGSANVYTYTIEQTSVNTNFDTQSVLYNFNLNSSWTLPMGFTAEAFAFINSQRRTAQGKIPSFSMMNVGVKKDIWEKRGSLGLSLSNPFNRYRDFTTELKGSNFNQYSRYSVPFRSLSVNFSYNFGKMDFKDQQKRGKKKGVNNDDLKQDEDGQGGGRQ